MVFRIRHKPTGKFLRCTNTHVDCTKLEYYISRGVGKIFALRRNAEDRLKWLNKFFPNEWELVEG